MAQERVSCGWHVSVWKWDSKKLFNYVHIWGEVHNLYRSSKLSYLSVNNHVVKDFPQTGRRWGLKYKLRKMEIRIAEKYISKPQYYKNILLSWRHELLVILLEQGIYILGHIHYTSFNFLSETLKLFYDQLYIWEMPDSRKSSDKFVSARKTYS